MAVTSMVVGATTPDGATFVAKVTGGGPVRVAVALTEDMTAPVFTASQAVNGQGVAKVSITGLAADTRHWWQVEDNGVVDVSLTGQFRTHPPLGLPATFTIGIIGDAGLEPETPGVGTVLAADRLSNHVAFDTVRARALAEDWLMVQHLGDVHYYDLGSGDHGIVGGGLLTNYRAGYDDVLTQPRQAQLYREVPWNLLWDDHDYGPNNSDGTNPNKANAAQAHRERTPNYPPVELTGAIYHSFQVGRVLFVAADPRFEKSPSGDPDGPAKTMLGAAQLAWMDGLLASTTAKFLVWLMPGQWMGTSTDSWASYQTEQAELVAMFGNHGFLGRMCIVGADAHIVALDTGGPNSPGAIAVLQAAAIDATPGFGDPADYNLGGLADRHQYGTVTIADQGSHLTVTLTGWNGTGTVVTHSFAVLGDPPPQASSGALTRTLAGSHRMLVEARVVTEFQDGPEPAGTIIPILGGDVQLDGTADIRGNVQLDTAGPDDSTGVSLFPRRPGDLLAPYGHELFIRRGVDLGGAGPLWIPLGYYRINSVEQDDAPYGPIRITGQDRMCGIVDNRLLTPREIAADRTVMSVFNEAVREVYPEAAIVFDDDTGSDTIGRVLVVEDSWRPVLAEIATGLGKIAFWDGEGILRVETAPDESIPIWEVKAGAGGVQVSAGRRVSREGVFNGWVVTGEAGDNQVVPARGVAIDIGPNSPTLWGGPFGRVPGFFTSPFIRTNVQAENAAREKLRNTIGAPKSVDFASVVNPALRPYDPVWVEYADFNREVHIMDRVTIPLVENVAMTGDTREKTLVVIGSVPS